MVEDENIDLNAPRSVNEYLRIILAEITLLKKNMMTYESKEGGLAQRIGDLEKHVAIIEERYEMNKKNTQIWLAIVSVAGPMLTGLIMWLVDMARL